MIAGFRLLAGIAFIYICGATVLSLLGYCHRDMLKRPYLLFCFGSGFISFALFAALLFKIQISLHTGIAVFLGLLFVTMLKNIFMRGGKIRWSLCRVRSDDIKNDIGGCEKLIRIVCIVIIAIQVICVLIVCLEQPENSWDGMARWGFKAKVIYSEKSVYVDYFNGSHYAFSHPYYPLSVPLEMVNIYLFLGEANDRMVKLVFFLYFVMLITAFFDIVKRFLLMSRALFFTALLSTVPIFLLGGSSAATCLANVPLAFYCLAAVLFLMEYLQQRRVEIIVPAGLVLFFCAFTKLEGLYYAAIFTIGFAGSIIIFDKNRRRQEPFLQHLFLLIGTFIVLYLPWLWFKALYIRLDHATFPSAVSLGYIISKLHRLIFVVPMLIFECLKVWHWHIAWIIFAGYFILGLKVRRLGREAIFLLSIIAGAFILLTAVYTVSSWWGALVLAIMTTVPKVITVVPS